MQSSVMNASYLHTMEQDYNLGQKGMTYYGEIRN